MKGNAMDGKRIVVSILTRIKAELDKSADFFELGPSPETFVKIGGMFVNAVAACAGPGPAVKTYCRSEQS